MRYFNLLKAKNRITIPPFWADQAMFLRHGFALGFSLEFIFLYFNAYDNFIRKATMKCLDRARYSDYKLKERSKLDVIKEEKKEKLRKLQELAK